MAAEIISKRCSKCKEIKPISEFHKNRSTKDGLDSYCKICRLKIKKKYRQTEKCKAARKRYAQSEKGKAVHKQWRQSEKGKAANRKTVSKYQKTAKGKAKRKRFKTRHPNQLKAKYAIKTEIRAGRMQKASSHKCVYCGKQAQQYHHPSYAPENWLKVVPVCEDCHRNIPRTI